MPIRDRTVNNQTKPSPQDEQEKRTKLAEAFISNAGNTQPPEAEEEGRTPIMVRYQKQMLKQIDAAAKRRGLSRSAWLQYAASRVLEIEEKNQ